MPESSAVCGQASPNWNRYEWVSLEVSNFSYAILFVLPGDLSFALHFCSFLVKRNERLLPLTLLSIFCFEFSSILLSGYLRITRIIIQWRRTKASWNNDGMGKVHAFHAFTQGAASCRLWYLKGFLVISVCKRQLSSNQQPWPVWKSAMRSHSHSLEKVHRFRERLESDHPHLPTPWQVYPNQVFIVFFLCDAYLSFSLTCTIDVGASGGYNVKTFLSVYRGLSTCSSIICLFIYDMVWVGSTLILSRMGVLFIIFEIETFILTKPWW